MKKILLFGIIALFLFNLTPAFAGIKADANDKTQQNEKILEQTCTKLLKNIGAYKTDKDVEKGDMVFYTYDYNFLEKMYVIGQLTNHYRNYYYFSSDEKYLGIITMKVSEKNKDDVVFTSQTPKGKVIYKFIADYYVVMSSRKVNFSINEATVYFPGGKHITIHKGETGILKNNGTFKLKKNNIFLFFWIKNYNAFGHLVLF